MKRAFAFACLVFASMATGTPAQRRVLENYSCPEDGLIKAAIFDADGTLRVSRKGALYPQTADDVSLLPMLKKQIRVFNDQGYLVAIMSNQGGVPRQLSFTDASAVASETAKMVSDLGVTVNYYDFSTKCYEAPEQGDCAGWQGPESDDYRKPNIGMARMLEQKVREQCPGARLDLSSSFFVGDAGYKRGVDGPHPDGRPADDFSNSDRHFAENAGIAFQEPTDFFGWREFKFYNFSNVSQLARFVELLQDEIVRLRREDQDTLADEYQRIIDETGPF